MHKLKGSCRHSATTTVLQEGPCTSQLPQTKPSHTYGTRPAHPGGCCTPAASGYQLLLSCFHFLEVRGRATEPPPLLGSWFMVGGMRGAEEGLPLSPDSAADGEGWLGSAAGMGLVSSCLGGSAA